MKYFYGMERWLYYSLLDHKLEPKTQKTKRDFTPPTWEQRCEKLNLEVNLLKFNIK